jgi:hypothetical protein
MRRPLAMVISALVVTPVVLALPVYAAPAPEAEPVEASVETVEMGSIQEPADEVEVQEGTTEPVESQTPAETVAPVLAVSEPRTDSFSALGVTWAHDPAVTDTLVHVRVADASGRWGEWAEVGTEAFDVEPGTDSGAAQRGGTSPLWTGESHGVEVELLTRSGAAPSDVRVELIDPGTSAADRTPGTPAAQDQAHAAMTMPPIYSRAQWGADEGIRTWDPEYPSTLQAATIHHTADSNNYGAADVPQIMRSIYRYHAVSLGWGDIGYNVVVDKFGRAWEGRYGGLASTVIGAHAGGFNTGTFGVSMLGNYDTVQPTAVMLETVAQVVAWKFSLYGINPRANVQLTSRGGGTAKYPAGTAVSVPTLFAHRDVGNTACPGQYGYAKMNWLRDRVAQIVDRAPNERWWELRDTADAGRAGHQVWYGGPDAVALACDFNGDGRDDVVAVDGATWYLRTSVSGGAPDAVFAYGVPGWTAVCGDWDGDGRAGIGMYDGAGMWYLRNSASGGAPDAGRFQYGWWAADPVVGDWDGDGKDTVGAYERGVGNWLVRNSNTPGSPHKTVQYGFVGAQPVPADYDGDGRTDLGVFAAGTWWLRMSFSPGAAHRVVGYGLSTDDPVTGDWDGARGDGIGVNRPGRR